MKLPPIKTSNLNEASPYKTIKLNEASSYKICEMHSPKQIPLTYS